MAKLRKQRRLKKYRYNINRKRLRNKTDNIGTVACKELKDAWDNKKSLKSNLDSMGLAYDPNVTIAVGKKTEQLEDQQEADVGTTSQVVEALEREAKAPRERAIRLPNSQVEWLTYLMDKYGDDYRAMTRDKRNHYQETWKQLRAKIKRFKSIPEQYNPYLENRNVNISVNIVESLSDDEI